MNIKDLVELQCANANVMFPSVDFIVDQHFEGGGWVIMFDSDGMGIFDPMTSSCGRFELTEEQILEEYKLPLWMAKWLTTINKYFIEIQEGL